MAKSLRRKNAWVPLLIASLVFFAITMILLSLRNNEFIAEYVFTRGFARYYITAVGTVTSIFPFSVFEILCGVLIIYVVATIVICIRRARKKRKGILRPIFTVVFVVSVVCCLYTATASFSYYRQPLTDNIIQYEDTLTDEEAVNIVNACLNDFNELSTRFERTEDGALICPYDLDELEEIVKKEYDRLDSDYFTEFTADLKPLITSDIFSCFGIIGLSFQVTAEANYNVNTDATDLPHTMLHELAHSKGVMYESDAELLATYLSLTSKNDYVRYSGYHNSFVQLARILKLHGLTDAYNQCIKALNYEIRLESAKASESYQSYQSFITDVGEFFNDIYLKINGASDGTGSYYISGTINTIITPEGETKTNVIYSPIQKMMIALYK